MDYRYKVFLAVANNLSFSKAAEELFISQPAVTKHIKELENKLCIALFLRKGNRISLTTAGNIVYNYAQKAFSLHTELEYEIGALKNTMKGRLRLGASSTISQYILPQILADFHSRFPGIEVSLNNGNSFDMEKMLAGGQIDIAIVENQSSRADFRYKKLIEDEIVAITGINSNYAKLNSINLNDLQTMPLILRERGSGTLEVIEHQLKKANIDIESLNIVIHLGSTEAIKNFLTHYDGIGLVSIKSIKKEIQLNSLKIIPIKNLKIFRDFRIVLTKGPETGFVDKFIQFLCNYNF